MADETDKDNGDYLGYGVYAETLWNRIQAALDKDLGSGKTLGDDPLVVGIFGEWGAGKSTLLKLTLDRASDYEAQRARHRSGAEGGFGDAGFGLTVPVLFQPWKYEHEPHLLVPLLLHIIQALRDSIPKAQTPSEKTAQATNNVWTSSIEALPALVENFEAVYKATVADLAVADPVTAVGVSIGFKTVGWLTRLLKRPDEADWLRDFKFSTEGRFYYNFHNVLCALTRPGKRAEAIGKLKLSSNARINFVIFIDDLDRCLPEKAVETLELIKTVFNLESFAFVLALDDEVVERGIGHRYRDYALVNKKPEMPITGFEYMEKIIHLPLRLPPLTTAQATAFLERYEQELLQGRSLRGGQTQSAWIEQRTWFSHRASTSWTEVQSRADGTSFDVEKTTFLFLGNLVVASFDSCTPRKLVRVVELWHQVLDVLEHHCLAGKPSLVKVGGDIDPRLLMAVVLLQLFQPELFRSMRRSKRGFDVLLDGFKLSSEQPIPLTDGVSDLDLLHWAAYQVGEKPPLNISEALGRVADLDLGKRSAAQRQRLPLVVSLLDHRSAQRHSFDPLKLFAALHRSREGFDAVGLPDDTFPYFSVLSSVRSKGWFDGAEIPTFQTATGISYLPSKGEDDSLVEPVHAPVEVGLALDTDTARGDNAASVRNFFRGGEAYRRIPEPVKVFQMLISPEDAEQRHVAEVAGLSPDAPLLHPESSRVLRGMVEREFLSVRIKGDNEAFVADRRGRVLRGLSYLATHIPPEERTAWWALVEDAPHSPAPFENLEQLHAQERWMDVRSSLGIDNDPVKGRFDPKRFHLPRERFLGNGEEEEPIPGFVRVFQQPSETFQPFSGPAVWLSRFYMARYLTTVDQYAEFIDAGGYGALDAPKPAWWDTLGWLWRTGQQTRLRNGGIHALVAQRGTEQRGAPLHWSDQLVHGNRPVTQICWFEARAYAAWLNLQLGSELKGRLEGYSVRLPTEVQWERAARAKDADSADKRRYPWDSSEDPVAHLNLTAHLHANIESDNSGRLSPVGLFEPSPIGLLDLCGNAWEWQNNLSGPGSVGQNLGVPWDVKELKTGESFEDIDMLALRGGTTHRDIFVYHLGANDRRPPDVTHVGAGIRLVLSQNPPLSDLF